MSDTDSGRGSPQPDAAYVKHDAHPDREEMLPLIAADLPDPVPVRKVIRTSSVLVMMTLQQSHDPNDLKTAMQRMLDLAVDDTILPYLEEHNAHLDVISVMRHLTSHMDTQITGLGTLIEFITRSPVLYESLQKSDAYRHVIYILNLYGSNVHIQSLGIRVLAYLIQAESIMIEIAEDQKDEELSDMMTAALTRFPDDIAILEHALLVLHYALRNNLCKQDAFMLSGFSTAVTSLRSHLHNDNIALPAFQLFMSLANTDRIQKQLVSENIHQLVKEAVCQSQQEAVIQTGCCLLSKLASEVLVQRYLITSAFLDDTLCTLLVHLPENSLIQEAGMAILECSVAAIHRRTMRVALITRERWLRMVYHALSKHIDKITVQLAGCRLLTQLFHFFPHVAKWVGEDFNQNQYPIHTLVLGALLVHGNSEELCTACSNTIYWMSADNSLIKHLLMMKNSHIAIVESLKHHHKEAAIVESLCRALRGITIFCYSSKHALASYGIVPLLYSLLARYSSDVGVQVEVLALVAGLMDIEFVRDACINHELYHLLLIAVQNHALNPLLHEVVLEGLIMIASTEAGVQSLITADALRMLLKTMTVFSDSSYILTKGLILIQLLADNAMMQTEAQCHQLLQVISMAMTQFSDVLIIQIEACVVLQLLAEKSLMMAEILVESIIPQLLFDLINQPAGRVDVLAAECLYVVACIQNLKSPMLLSVAAKDNLTAVECLVELGAEVNDGEGQNTPLYHACFHGDEDMVRFLLQQGVADVQSSLKLSLEKKQSMITGLLLRHIGREQQAGSVSWSGLDLGDLQPEWLAPTLIPELAPPQTSYAAKDLANKIMGIQERRSLHAGSNMSSNAVRYRFMSLDLPVPWDKLLDDDSIEATSIRAPSVSRAESVMSEYPKSRQSLLKDVIFPKPRRPSYLPLQPVSVSNTAASIYSSIDSIILSRSPAGTPVSPFKELRYFVTSVEEERSWHEMTVSGANIPYNISDPRQSTVPSQNKITEIKGLWQRKSASTHDSSNQIMDTTYGNAQDTCWRTNGRKVVRRPSLPAIPTCGGRLAANVKRAHSHSQRRGSRIALPRITEPFHVEFSRLEGSDPDIPMEDRLHKHFHTIPVAVPPEKPHEVVQRKRSRSLGSLESSFSYFEMQVTTLDLSSNAITSLLGILQAGPSMLCKLNSLEKLDLSKNALEAFPHEVFEYLPSLKQLDLSHNELMTFPYGSLHCAELAILDLSHNKIEDVHQKMLVTSFSVREFNMSYNHMLIYPVWLRESMPGLEILSLEGNGIDSLPECSVSLKRLKRLELTHNDIHVIPEEFLRDCSRLVVLDLRHNHLENLPSDEIAQGLVKLSKLRLRNNHLAVRDPLFIPKFILELPSLQSLDVSENGLTGLPAPSMWKCHGLKELYASKNNIVSLCLENCGVAWPGLEILHLSHNKLSLLPSEIGQLTSLASLDISYNSQMTTLPDDLGRCAKIWEMPLDGMYLDLDPALLRGRVRDLTVYLHNKLKKARRHYRIKMIVVGYAGKGKTSLLRSLMRRRQPKVNHATVGIVVRDWKFDCRATNGKMVMYTLSTWDFAGQEDFYSSHQCFLSQRALYLAVYDLSVGGEQEIEHLKPWLLNIQARAPGCPVIVVGSHLDQVKPDYRSYALNEMSEQITELVSRTGYPHVSGLIAVDCTKDSSSGMDKLRSLIKTTVDEYKVRGQPVMGQKIPASYVRLAEFLAEEARFLRHSSYPVIRHSGLLKIVAAAEIDIDEDELQQAVRFLHESGVLIHYEDSALQLKDLYFIDPGWLCRMMAQIVTVREINPFIGPDGILKKDSVSLLFTDRSMEGDISYTFPPSLIPQYLRILEKFEIVLPKSDSELLIPCRLPKERPSIQLPKPTRLGRLCVQYPLKDTLTPIVDYIQREYHLPFVPMGFWPRLLARLIVFWRRLSTQGLFNYWRGGIYAFWSDDSFFLLEPLEDNNEVLQLTVPATIEGSRLLGKVVDHMDALIEEWFPGLITLDPLLGRELLERLIPCVYCNGSDVERYLFTVDELVKAAEEHDEIFCPQHQGYVPLPLLAPDVMLSDLQPHFALDPEQFVFVQSPEYLLGDGGFASVYSGRYKKQIVAIKTYTTVSFGEIHPHKLLRQEATILSQLQHPSIVSLLAVSMRPRVIVIEFAPLGTLGGLIKANSLLNRSLIHRIALQVTEGLAYLHDSLIMYRDLKPDNILLFNLSLGAMINVKLSDYGISRMATVYGLVAQEGTLGYRAPEVIRGEAYSFSADIFSLGVTLYELLTSGKHPHDELEYRCEMDKAVAQGQVFVPLARRGLAPWPDMYELIHGCLIQVPEQRPTAEMMFENLKSPELLCLKQITAVCSEESIEALTVRFSEGGANVEVWVASGCSDCVQLSWVNILGHGTVQGMYFSDKRVLCLYSLGAEHVLVGCQSGHIWVYDAVEYFCKHCLPKLSDAVLCMHTLKGSSGAEMLIAGLADGTLAMYNANDVIQSCIVEADFLELGSDYEPVKCMCPVGNRLYISCGSRVFCVQYDLKLVIERMWDTSDYTQSMAPSINCMVVGRHLYVTKRASSVIELWDTSREALRDTVDLAEILKISKENQIDGRITSMALQTTRFLWLGTRGGHVILLDGNQLRPLLVTQRYVDAVRCLSVTKHMDQYIIITGGLGFCDQSDSHGPAADAQIGSLAVWEQDSANHIKSLKEDVRRRQELVARYSECHRQ